MRITVLLAGLMGLSLSAHATGFDLRSDPSGAPMCFSASGDKAPLVRCQVPVTATYFTSFDPSGAPMCFASNGDKALLARCQVTVTASYVTALDPSGAPMCFTQSGEKAPLSRCTTAMLTGQLWQTTDVGPLALIGF
jgi:hypothetical protein